MLFAFKVFVKEQNVPIELELDEKDYSENTVHIGYFNDDKLIGVARLIDMNKDVIHIGRVVIDKEYRGKGIGRKLIVGCEITAKNILKRKIVIELSAQIQAEKILWIIRLQSSEWQNIFRCRYWACRYEESN